MNDRGTAIHNPGNVQPINELYAYLSIDEAGNEGVMGGIKTDGSAFTFCFGDEATARNFEKIIGQIAEAGKMKIRLVKFTSKEILKEINYE